MDLFVSTFEYYESNIADIAVRVGTNSKMKMKIMNVSIGSIGH